MRKPASANVWWPAGPTADLPSAQTSTAAVPWYSRECIVSVQVQVPAGWTLGQFYAATAKIGPILDPTIRAWETWFWWVANPAGQNTTGFYFNQPNLDWSPFRV